MRLDVIKDIAEKMLRYSKEKSEEYGEYSQMTLYNPSAIDRHAEMIGFSYADLTEEEISTIYQMVNYQLEEINKQRQELGTSRK